MLTLYKMVKDLFSLSNSLAMGRKMQRKKKTLMEAKRAISQSNEQAALNKKSV